MALIKKCLKLPCSVITFFSHRATGRLYSSTQSGAAQLSRLHCRCRKLMAKNLASVIFIRPIVAVCSSSIFWPAHEHYITWTANICVFSVSFCSKNVFGDQLCERVNVYRLSHDAAIYSIQGSPKSKPPSNDQNIAINRIKTCK